MKDKISSFLIRFLPVALKDKIKLLVINSKKKFPNLFLFFNGKFGSKELINEIEQQIDDSFNILMVHSSYNNLLPMYQGNVVEIIEGLIQLCEKNNMTLIMPGFFLGKKNKGAEAYYESGKIFNLQKTPTTVGLINEFFRRKKGVKRSIHPTHSILAYGPKSEEIVRNHHLANTTFGKETPFYKMNSDNTLIIGIGVYYYRNLTHVHVVEDILGDDYPYPVERKYKEVKAKLNSRNDTYEYNLKIYTDGLAKIRDLSILRNYMSNADLKQWKFKGVPMFYAKASKVTETLLDLAKNDKGIYNS